METANFLIVVIAITVVAGIGIGSMVWAYVGTGSRAVLFKEPISNVVSDQKAEALQQFQQGLIAFREGHYPAAIEQFTQVIQLDPTFAEVYHDRGLAFANLRRDDDATFNLVKASELYLERGDRASVTIVKQNLEALKARKQAREKAS
ncbi:hypothetical protein C7B65_23045 [Phormidesmis priestleyi ULC007]|uniref:Uncharacterized protein n=1 Tax=Phormidesmis priestleyi ULC007 TaxID=1920490 RepID=A0A2T1D660_9CYAN|nr:tetratricopeptide repeat protein [Phormidesmis priestleyi]PSB15936.1 hypothetical protein C7B65_23045 [Phormidesmis priestleyi ULC007]PZO49825.1 MAG: tetratricopeptide repeat protein [Phormidesmis priestleyi]